MKYNFETTVDRSETLAIKTDKTMVETLLGFNYYNDTIPMWVADMDFICAPEIVEALNKRVSLASFGYTKFDEQYFTTLIDWYRRRLNMQIEREWVVFSNGTVLAIRNVVRTYTSEGDGVIIQTPVYYPFKTVPIECNRTIVENSLIIDENNNYSIDFDLFEEQCAEPNNKLFIFCNPHNPIGQIWSKEDVQRLVDICRKHNVIFFSDEVHSDLLRKDALFTSTLNLNNIDGVIVATAANKTFNLAGLHITNLIIPNEELRSQLNRYTGMQFAPPFTQVASIAAYGKGEEWVNEMNAVLDDNISYMDNFFRDNMPKVRFNPPQGTYLTWVDFRAYGIEERELLELCANEAHLILEGGSMFGDNSAGFIRINIACPKSVLIEALNRLKKTFHLR